MHNSLATSSLRRRSAGKATSPSACNDVISLIAREKNLPIRIFTHRSRCEIGVARGRQLAMYLAHVVLRRSLTEIGDVFGRDRTTVSHACALIEDMRDDPAFDAEVSAYERCLEALLGSTGHAR